MRLTPKQIGLLADSVLMAVTKYPFGPEDGRNKNTGDESTALWEKHLAKLIDQSPDWSFDYVQLCEAEPVLLDFLIEYYSSKS